MLANRKESAPGLRLFINNCVLLTRACTGIVADVLQKLRIAIETDRAKAGFLRIVFVHGLLMLYPLHHSMTCC